MSDQTQVWVVEDNADVRQSICQLLKFGGFAPLSFVNAEDAIATDSALPALAIVDFRLPGMSGVELLANWRSRGIEFPVILISGNFDSVTHLRIEQFGNTLCIQKPFRPASILNAINSCIGTNLELSNKYNEAG